MSRELSSDEEKYNTEFLLCDSFWAFHPEFFEILTEQESNVLWAYYPQDVTRIPDVFVFRQRVLRQDPGLAARALLAKVLGPVGVNLPD